MNGIPTAAHGRNEHRYDKPTVCISIHIRSPFVNSRRKTSVPNWHSTIDDSQGFRFCTWMPNTALNQRPSHTSSRRNELWFGSTDAGCVRQSASELGVIPRVSCHTTRHAGPHRAVRRRARFRDAATKPNRGNEIVAIRRRVTVGCSGLFLRCGRDSQ